MVAGAPTPPHQATQLIIDQPYQLVRGVRIASFDCRQNEAEVAYLF
jgi:hypothetical protein